MACQCRPFPAESRLATETQSHSQHLTTPAISARIRPIRAGNEYLIGGSLPLLTILTARTGGSWGGMEYAGRVLCKCGNSLRDSRLQTPKIPPNGIVFSIKCHVCSPDTQPITQGIETSAAAPSPLLEFSASNRGLRPLTMGISTRIWPRSTNTQKNFPDDLHLQSILLASGSGSHTPTHPDQPENPLRMPVPQTERAGGRARGECGVGNGYPFAKHTARVYRTRIAGVERRDKRFLPRRFRLRAFLPCPSQFQRPLPTKLDSLINVSD